MGLADDRRAAQTATNAQEWSQAASLWEHVYQVEQTATTNYQLVTALVHDEQYGAASTYAAEFEREYLKTDVAADLYVQALLMSHQYIVARSFIVARKTVPSWQAGATKRVVIAETGAEKKLQTTLTTTMRQFYHLSDQPVTAQAERIEAARHLTLAKYLTAAQFLLVDPFLHQLSRVEVLYQLRALGVDQAVPFVWLDGTQRRVVPATLPVMGTDRTSQTVRQTFQNNWGQHDASLNEGLAALLDLQLMYLYPEPERVINDPDAWVNIFVGMQTGSLDSQQQNTWPELVAVQTKIQTLNLELQN